MGSSLINFDKLEEIVPEFEVYLNGEGIKYIRERNKVSDYLKVYLFQEEAIDSLDKETIENLVSKLWAFDDCADTNFIVDEILRSGLGVIRDSFKFLINEDEPVDKRFDEVLKNIRMIDDVVLSEVLSHFNDKKYPLWVNNKIYYSLKYLEVPKDRLPSQGQLNGKQYEIYANLLQGILYEIKDYYPKIDSVFKLSFLLDFMANKGYKYDKSAEEDKINDENKYDGSINSANVINQVLQLGSELGFEIEKDITMTSKYSIDAVWKSKIANVVITYAFEVLEEDANIRFIAAKIADIMRLDASIQKVIVISTYSQFENLKDKVTEFHISKNSMIYFNVNDLNRALSYLESLKEILDDLGLLKFNS
ncbi:hypothetical protein [Natranaerofaba carboxydovora]|uniref:hypothetical protein n=1 Tax=Natranaerofaba carboxydovora TaxID=2742683 RepID=UPI001F133381|nr:hypothetical protein [Natranaerofaba carboxydovora]UMZ73842.1 hypothetical protein ACONDI_01411 [Natranaerofaba carboxydovora]